MSADDPRRTLQQGYWWSLHEEPLPFHNGAGLLNTLASITNGNVDNAWEILRERLDADLTTDESHLIGFRYPSRRGGSEWLILWVLRNVQKSSGGILIQSSDADKRRSFENSALGVVRVHRIKPAVLRQRNKGAVNEEIDKNTVALIGLGALGSKVAELLAQAGIGKFRLCDNVRLSSGRRTTEKQRNSNNCSLKREYSGMCQ